MKRFINFFVCFAVALIPTMTQAISKADNDAVVNNTIYYDPAANSIACADGGTVSGSSVQEKIWNLLIGKGLSAVQTAGVMGNMQAESGFSPTRQEASQTFPAGGWGLAQWTFGRRLTLVAALQKQPDIATFYANQYGGPADTKTGLPPGVPVDKDDELILFEINYLVQESMARPVTAAGFNGPNEWAVLKQQTTVENATVFWHNNFEVSNDTPEQVIKNRGGFATSIFNSFSGTNKAAGPNVSCSPASTLSASANGLATTLLAYAWPDYKGEGWITREPGYIAAITAAQAKHQYTGYNNGIDCGGFMTTLITLSGYDPTYNTSGHGGNTISQLAWDKANWQDLGPAKSINPATLKTGDVAVSDDHTFMWVGTLNGFNAKMASASGASSISDPTNRAPMADTAQNPTESGFEWFRKK